MRFSSTTPFLLGLFTLAQGCSHREHPYLAFDKAEIPALRQRAKQKPYSFWMAAVEANAACGLKFTPGKVNSQCPSSTVPPGLTCPWASAATNEACQSGYAFNLALANIITPNPAYVQQTANLLLNAGKYEQGWRNTTAGAWYWGADLENYAFAYDMIQPYLTPEQDSAINKVLAGMLRGTMVAYLDPTNIAYVTNIRMRVGSGAGTLAIASNGRGASSDFAYTIERDLFSYGHLAPGLVDKYVATTVTPEGTLNEGPSYQNDAFLVMLPYLYVLKRLEGRDYINGKNTLPGWRGDNRIAKMFERNAALSMPDKNSATFATGWRAGFTFGNVAAPGLPTPSNKEVEWFFAWQEGSGGIGQTTPGFAFFYADAELTHTKPSYLSLVTPDWTSFRTGWDPDAMFFLMQSEYWPEYSSHGQPDQTSFILYAKNRYLLIDPGDGRNYCTSSGCTPSAQINRSPEAHNLVIVDNKRGCDDDNQTPSRLHGSYRQTRDPATLLAGFVSPELNSSMITLQNYFSVPDVSTYRTAMMARDRYIVVFDGMVAKSNKSHTYDAYLHFGGPVSNTADVCQRAQTGTNETCGSSESDQLCWNKPMIEEVPAPDPRNFDIEGSENTEGVPRSCSKKGTSPLPSGVTDCGTVIGALNTGSNGSDRLTWTTTSNNGEPIELSAVFAPAPNSFAVGSYPTNFYPNAVFTHPYARAQYAGTTTQWLNVLYPRKVGATEPTPVIAAKSVRGGQGAALSIKIDAETIDDLGIVSDGAAVVTVPDEASFQGRSALLLRTAGKFVRANVHEARSLAIQGELVFSANQPTHAMISRPHGSTIMEIVGSQPTRVCLRAPAPTAKLVLDRRHVEANHEAPSMVCATVPKGKHVLEVR